MIHWKILSEACPQCNAVGKFGILFVSNNHVVRGCSACNFTGSIKLPTLKKTIIYLDQFFLSAAFRSNQSKFVDARERIVDLATRQLIVCPWSDIHEAETHQWPDAKQ